MVLGVCRALPAPLPGLAPYLVASLTGIRLWALAARGALCWEGASTRLGLRGEKARAKGRGV